MLRSKWKIKLILKEKKKNKIKIFNPNFIILNEYLGNIFYVYNGKRFIKIIITNDMIGYNLNKFIITRFNNGSIHIKKKNKNKR